ncbi:phosphatidylinositol transfer protein [Ascobolus immersus RN42]|uniref:Phosphatidylglycerol/phosphatidylinositol transfer protein n=1 Tax=Ascobolus immersus RN42 TaxID=1160509 RepID=A0A3N4HJA8_ASCIM|nr:phosphatidylinositol transfer protein [Ascobolus immersus RN42]
MHFSNLIAVLPVFASLSAAAALKSPANVSILGSTGPEVPGENPLKFCSKPSEDLIQIDKVDLVPNPPLPGQTLSISAAGTVKKPILEGSYISLSVKYGYIKLIQQELDLCENVHEVGLECPIAPGDLLLQKEVDLPKAIPPGKYTVLANVYNQDDDQITCLTANAQV